MSDYSDDLIARLRFALDPQNGYAERAAAADHLIGNMQGLIGVMETFMHNPAESVTNNVFDGMALLGTVVLDDSVDEWEVQAAWVAYDQNGQYISSHDTEAEARDAVKASVVAA